MVYYDELKHIIEMLPVPSGMHAGKNITLTKWQDTILRDCFATDHRYEIIYVEIPRKNGKTTFVAGLLLALFLVDKEPGAEFYCASGDKEQASIIFRIARSMIHSRPALQKRIHVVPSTKMFIKKDDENRTFRSLSADAHSKHGYNPYFTVFDEFHIFRTRDLWDVMDTGDIAREKPTKLIITTAGTDTASLCGEFHEHAEDIISGKASDDTFKPYLYTVKDKEHWQEEEQWFHANPSMQEGLFPVEKLRSKFNRALGRPTAERAFKRLHLDIWQEAAHDWISLERFDRGKTVLDDAIFNRSVGGLDLGFGRDTSSFTLYRDTGKEVFFRSYIWVTQDEASRLEQLNGTPWSKWIREGYVHTYGKEAADYDILFNDISVLLKKHHVKYVGFDRWKSHGLIHKLAKFSEMVPVGQGFATMTAPVKIFENHILGDKVKHEGNPAVRHQFAKVYIKEDAAGNAKPDKSKSSEKIDSVVALLTALAVSEAKEVNKKSVYAYRGLK
jgi:phage terminase large subunit-like protein